MEILTRAATRLSLRHVMDGCIPSDPWRRLDAEDRGGAAAALDCYDARREPASSDGAAVFLHPRERSLVDRHVYAQRTRFIVEPVVVPAATWQRPARPARKPIDVKAHMRGMWG